MATLDTSRVINNPRFRQAIAVERTTFALDSYGDPVASGAPVVTSGVTAIVTAGGQDQLDRAEDGSKRSGQISVITRFRLQSGDAEQADGTYLEADVVIYAGRRHTVTSVDDYTRLGAGWVIATCRSTFVNPPAPVGVDAAPAPENPDAVLD